MIKRIAVEELSSKLTQFLNSINIAGTTEITENIEEVHYVIKIGNYTFYGFYPECDEFTETHFTLQFVDGTKELPSGVIVDYIEAVVFNENFEPVEFIIHKYPETQTVYLADSKYFPKGTIKYEVMCPCGGGYTMQQIPEPAFTSEIIEIAEYVSAFLA